MASEPSSCTPPNSTAPSAATSPTNNRLFGFQNSHLAAFSPIQPKTNSSPMTTSQSSTSQTEDEDRNSDDIEFYISSLNCNNSIDDSIPISIATIDNSLANDERFGPSASSNSSALQSTISSQNPLPCPPSAPLQQTIPLPLVLDASSDSHASSRLKTSSDRSQVSHSSSPSTPDAQSGETLDPRSANADTSSSGTFETLKTSNVYINGLPPHFPEEQLLTLAAPFGPVRSVRTFTRHVRDNESGYGFVLFEDINSAEKCIQALRKYRNLHPTFSKAVHKIPGTYSQSQVNLQTNDPHAELDFVGQFTERAPDEKVNKIISVHGDETSFKTKMESLHDHTSTNLYMEGLPLSIDEPTLAALVSPHRISSSRFFQTRLSNPPRIIAFVRFETRSGAEEIIERLHGRMVRGWNDAGSRISVRFADTAEQRELRRAERSAREGEQSPARLTIAQASLLNLRGQEFKSKPLSAPHSGGSSLPLQPSSLPPPPIILGPRGLSPHPQPSPSYRYEYVNANPIHARSPAPTPPFTVDYSLTAGRGVGALTPLSRTQTPVHLHGSPYHTHSTLPLALQTNAEVRFPPPMDPNMTALLESLRGSGVPFHPSGAVGSGVSYNGVGVGVVGGGYNDVGFGQAAHHALGLGGTSLSSNLHTLGTNNTSLNLGLTGLDAAAVYTPGRATQARGGYTATEEYIMRAHAQAQQRQYELGPEQQLNLRREQLSQQQQQFQIQHESQQQYQRRRPPPLDLVRQHQQRQRADSDASIGGIGVGVRGYRAQAAAITVPGSAYRNLHSQPEDLDYSEASRANQVSSSHEGEYELTSSGELCQPRRQQEVPDAEKIPGAGVKHAPTHRVHPVTANARLSCDFSDGSIQQQQQQYPHTQQQSVHRQRFNQSQQQQAQLSQGQSQQQTLQSPHLFSQQSSPNPNLYQHHYQQAHLRSMTLPQRRPPSAIAQRHYQHSSMSVTVPSSGSSMNHQLSNTVNLHTNVQTNYTNNSNSTGVTHKTPSGKAISEVNNVGNGANTIDIYDGSANSPDLRQDGGPPSASRDNLHFDSTSKAQQRLQNAHSRHFESSRTSLYRHQHTQHQNGYDTDIPPHRSHHNHNQTSSSLNEFVSPALTTSSSSLELISPTLTYSAHTPASTLSPATPFFGSFSNVNVGPTGHHGTGEQTKVHEATAVGIVGMGVGDISD